MKKASIVMIIGSLMLLGAMVFPLWNIQLGAPQYPEPLGMNIFIDGIKGQSEFDIQNIDGLNHYIGMKTLPKPGDMWEFEIFPLINLIMAFFGLLIGVLAYLGKLRSYWFLLWFVLMTVLSFMGIYDFNLWMIDYGTNLDPHAILKLQNPDGTPMSYKPPLLGHKKLLNFDAYSYPRLGAILMFSGTFLAFVAYLMGRKKNLKSNGVASAFIVTFFLSMTSCSVEPKPISYGKDNCDFCRMTIVDKLYAAEIVTSKGKVFKFDASECMINYISENGEEEVAMLLTNHFGQPEELIDARSAVYLISEELQSPMGANLTAFSDRSSAENAQQQYSGELYNWEDLLKKFKVN